MPKNSEDDPSQGHRLSIVRLAAYVRNFLKLISTDYWPATFAFSIIVLGSVIMFLLEHLPIGDPCRRTVHSSESRALPGCFRGCLCFRSRHARFCARESDALWSQC